MLVVETIAKIRRAHFVEGKSIKQICRELRLSRNTVRKVIRSGATEFTYDRTVQRRVKIWRADMARSLVFGTDEDAQPQMTSDALRNLEAARVRGHLEPTEPDTTTGENPREQMGEATD